MSNYIANFFNRVIGKKKEAELIPIKQDTNISNKKK